MNRTAISGMVIGRAVVFFLATALAASLGGLAIADDARTLTGEYVWDHRDNSGPLEAVFTPTGENTWDVAFHFNFRGKPHTYSGTAEGSLSDGKLEGTVKNENKKRTFTFEGKFENGTFSGTHAELENGKPFRTGTLTLGS